MKIAKQVKEQIGKHSSKRKLRVQAKYFSRAYYQLVVFPEIRLSGKWLQDTGFLCGQLVTISYEQNKIIITVENEK